VGLYWAQQKQYGAYIGTTITIGATLAITIKGINYYYRDLTCPSPSKSVVLNPCVVLDAFV